jgi:hypothetical protein
MASALHAAELVFPDPDNGPGSMSFRHVTFAGISELRRSGRALVLTGFPGRTRGQPDLVSEFHASISLGYSY